MARFVSYRLSALNTTLKKRVMRRSVALSGLHFIGRSRSCSDQTVFVVLSIRRPLEVVKGKHKKRSTQEYGRFYS